MAREAALHLLGHAACAVGLVALALLAFCLVSPPGDPRHAQHLLVAAACSLSLGWGLRLSCDMAPDTVDARARLAVLAGGAVLVALCASLPWWLAHAGGAR